MNESCQMTNWQLLNDLRRHNGRLIYSPNRNAYFVHPAARWVAKSAVSALLADKLIEQAGLTAAVYRLSDRGKLRWSMMPPNVAVEGKCDRCGIVRRLRPTSDGVGCVFMCRQCRQAEVYDVLETKPSPA